MESRPSEAEPVRTWLAVQAQPERFSGLDKTPRLPFVGRQRELTILRETVARVESEGSPQLVTILGVPGIGKTRLVYELLQTLEESTELHGRSLPYGAGVSFWALAEIVKTYAGIRESDEPDIVAEKLRRAVDELGARDAAWIAARLRPLVGLETEADFHGDRYASFVAWGRFLEAIAERRPLVLVFEDLQWADPGMLDFIEHLVESSQRVPVLVLCTSRPELLDRRPDWGERAPEVLTLQLARISDGDAARLLSAALGQAARSDQTEDALLALAAGNPFYTEQYARLYLERRSVEDLPLPPTVHALIAARLDTLTPREKGLLYDAAVMGELFVAAALPEAGSSGEQLRSLEQKGFIRREPAREATHGFTHVLIREVAYGQIPRSERARKHLRAAKSLEELGRPHDYAELLAHHYAASLELLRAQGEDDPQLAARTRKALRQAGDRAVVLHAIAAAARFYERALTLDPPEEERARLALELGRAALTLGDAAAEDRLLIAREAAVAAGDVDTTAAADALLARLAREGGDADAALAHIDRASDLVRPRPPSPAKAEVLAEAARLLAYYRPADVPELAAEAIATAEAVSLDAVKADALVTLGVTVREKATVRKGITLAKRANALTPWIRGHINLGHLQFSTDIRRAVAINERLAVLTERYGIRGWPSPKTGLSGILWAAGRWDDALAQLDEEPEFISSSSVDALLARPGDVWKTSLRSRQLRAVIAAARGDDHQPLEVAQLSRAVARRLKEPGETVWTLIGAAHLFQLAGREAEANEAMDVALAAISELESETRNWFVGGAMVLAELGRRHSLFERTARLPLPPEPENDAGRAYIEGDLVKAGDIFEAWGHVSYAARARLRGGERLVAEGRTAEATQMLGKALAFYRSVGANRYIAEAETLLSSAA